MVDVDRRTWRPCEPPQPVFVRVAAVLPPAPVGWGRSVPMRVRAGGLRLDEIVPGALLARAQDQTGQWWYLVDTQLHIQRGEIAIAVRLFVRAAALTRSDAFGADPAQTPAQP